MTCRLLRERIAVCLIVLLCGLAGGRSIDAQNIAASVAAATIGQADAATTEADVRFSIDADSRFGSRTYVPENWQELHISLENRSGSVQELLCTSYFGSQPELQFGRQVWLPPHSRLSVSHPILVPSADQAADGQAVVHSLVIDRSQGNEVLLKNQSGQLRHERTLLITNTDRNTGVVAGWSAADSMPQDVLDLLVAARVGQALPNKVAILSDQFLPAEETTLGYLDHLVLADNRLVEDVAALGAVRRWLHAGGRLWIMLDRCDPVVLESLFGDEFVGQLVDHVGLTTVRVDKAPTLITPEGETGESVEYDEPVQLARMVVSGMKVWNTVNGWPAAMTRSYGQGRVLITTLGPRGWLKPTPPDPVVDPDKRKPFRPELVSPFAPRGPMEDLAAYVLAPRTPEPLPESDLEPLAQEYVSYEVPKWSLIVGIMSGFLALLSIAGLWLWRIERLERFGWIGSCLAVLFGTALIGIGMANRHREPESISSVQLAQAVSGTDDVRTRGMLAVYRPEASQAPVQVVHGGRLWPESNDADGATHRLVMSDLRTSEWEGLTQPAGLQMYSDRTSRSHTERLLARATIDGAGVAGRFLGHSASTEDALLATRYGRVGVELAGDGRFTAAAADVFDSDQYINATLLGDTQDRRRRILQHLFENPGWREGLNQPQLLVWMNDWDLGFQFGPDLQRQGETLLSVPLELTRPPAGTEMLIPSPLLSFATTRPPDGSPPAGFWDDDRGEWQERTGPSVTWLRFQVPQRLLPLKPMEGRLAVKVSGPMGRIEVMGVKEGSVVSLETVENPVGSLVFEIDDPDILAVEERGTLSLGVSAGVTIPLGGGGGTANYWRIDSLALQLSAVATEPAEVD